MKSLLINRLYVLNPDHYFFQIIHLNSAEIGKVERDTLTPRFRHTGPCAKV